MVKVALAPSVTPGASPMDTVRVSWSRIVVVAMLPVAETEPARWSVAALNISTLRVSSSSLMPSSIVGKVMVPLDWPAEISRTPASPVTSPGGNVIAPMGAV